MPSTIPITPSAVDQVAQADEHLLAAVVAPDAVDEAAVELHAPHRQVVEHGEGAVPAAEVVDEDPHAGVVERLEVPAGRARQLEGDALGELEHEPVGIDGVARAGMLDAGGGRGAARSRARG